jgi:hypothetical protein
MISLRNRRWAIMRIKKLSDDHVLEVIKTGEFSPDITHSKKKVVIILTQDWCPDWKSMKEWLDLLDDTIDIDICELIYNKSEYFQNCLELKENKWNNSLIPYLRYYVNGVLIKESNYVTKEEFLKILNL